MQFTDQSLNLPTGWSWNFGDGSAPGTTQNPSHTYTTPGTYTVTLTTTNAAGTSATPATATITYNNVVPVAASCTPGTTAYFGGYGIVGFRLNTINNPSANGSVGYEDFTCPQQTRLVAGSAYPMTITTGGTNQHAVQVYLDGDANGIFTAGEKVYENLTTPAGGVTTSLIPPAGATPNVPLRLRIVSDFVGATLDPCTPRANGQVEDYTITIGPNTLPPTVDFTSDYVPGGCVNPIQFTDQSLGLDASTTWDWDFGDASLHGTARNPSHQYAGTGTYTVTLTVTNAIGMNTTTKTNYITVRVPCLVYCPSNGAGQMGGPGGGGGPSQFWITNVALAAPASTGPVLNFSNASGNSTNPNGYADYSSLVIPLNKGRQYTMTVVSSANFNHRTVVWIDTNQDGFFDNTTDERVINYAPNPPSSATHVQTFTIPTTLLTGGATPIGRTKMRVLTMAGGGGMANPCGVNIPNAEVEDYDVDVQPTLATREAAALPSLSVYPNPTLDGRLHLALADARAAGPYTATVQNLLGATLLETAVRLAPAPPPTWT